MHGTHFTENIRISGVMTMADIEKLKSFCLLHFKEAHYSKIHPNFLVAMYIYLHEVLARALHT